MKRWQNCKLNIYHSVNFRWLKNTVLYLKFHCKGAPHLRSLFFTVWINLRQRLDCLHHHHHTNGGPPHQLPRRRTNGGFPGPEACFLPLSSGPDRLQSDRSFLRFLGDVCSLSIFDWVRMRDVSHDVLFLHARVRSHEVALYDGGGSGMGHFCGALWFVFMVASWLGIPSLRHGYRHRAISLRNIVSICMKMTRKQRSLILVETPILSIKRWNATVMGPIFISLLLSFPHLSVSWLKAKIHLECQHNLKIMMYQNLRQ